MQLQVVDSVEVALLDSQIVDVNSSLIRFLIQNGRVRDAGICLARPYSIEGTVIQGNQRGRTIDVPTANLDLGEQLPPGDGVYAGRCVINRETYPCAISVGNLPTFNGTRKQVEVHLIGFKGDLYGKRLAVDLIDWIRDQRKFDGIGSLKSQLARDIRASEERFVLDPSREAVTIS
jgi:riboflavin kinase/FMN adenylyltransferase